MFEDQDASHEVKVVNPFDQVEAEEKQEEKKKARANVISLKPDDLCTNPLGLTYLY